MSGEATGFALRDCLNLLLERAKADADVLAVLLFGSAARAEQHQKSDLDVCLVLEPKQYERPFLTVKRMDYLSDFPSLDVQDLQELPLYIRHRVLKEAQVLLCRDDDRLYQLAFRTVLEWEDYYPLYRAYLEEVARVGS